MKKAVLVGGMPLSAEHTSLAAAGKVHALFPQVLGEGQVEEEHVPLPLPQLEGLLMMP